MKELLNKHAIISFDIFDTLLTRKFTSPSDVFIHMENAVTRLSKGMFRNFAYIRRKAEQEVISHYKSQGINEINIDEIYYEINILTGYPQELLEEIKALELQAEHEALLPRKAGTAIYKKALAMHKDIVLISDMYLPQSFIEAQLERFGITRYVKLYLSSTYREKKHDGALFKIFLDESGLDPNSILHVGDNPHGDIEQAKKHGITPYFIPKAVENYKNPVFDKEKTRSKSLTAKLIADSYYDEGKPPMKAELLGFSAFGPLIANFTAWLYKEAMREGVTRLYFCSRDSLIFKEAFEIMYPGEITCEYLKISRHIAKLHDLKSRPNLLFMANEPIFSTTIGDYLNYRFGLEKTDIPLKILEKHGINSLDFRIGGKFNRETLLALLIELEPLIYKTCERKTKHYARYLKAIKMGDGKSGIVDFGYAGTSQRFLSEITSTEIHGFYYQTFAKILNVIDDNSTIHSYNSPYLAGNGDDFISKNRFILETLICSPEDSFKHVEPQGKSRSRFDFVHFESSHDEARKNLVSQLHESALHFVSELKSRENNLTNFALDSITAEHSLQQYLANPVNPEIFAGVAFEDLYGPQVPRYIFPPLSDAKTMNQSQILWKAGHEVWLKSQAKPISKAPAKKSVTLTQTGHIIEPEPTFIGKILLQTEEKLVKQQVTPNKFIKYSTNRIGFFEDTQIKAAKVYYRLIGRKIL
jgi:predicted HAD superfamily hydrolase